MSQTIVMKPPAHAAPGPPPPAKATVDNDRDNGTGPTGKRVNLSA
jgi:hypothetical protein